MSLLVYGDEEYEMIASVEDLLDRLRMANERKLSMDASLDPDTALLQLRLPHAGDISNAELDVLKPLYCNLIKDIRENKEESVYLRCLFHREPDEPQDATMLMLYVLDYPGLVRGSRGDVTGLAGTTNRERFQLVDIADEIAADATIGSWCRNSITDSHRSKHNSEVLVNSIALLDHSVAPEGVPRSQVKKTVRNVLFRGEKDAIKAFAELRSDLAALLNERTDLHAQGVVHAITLQLHVLVALYGEDRVPTIMGNASNRESFERALARVQDTLGPAHYHRFRAILGSPTTMAENMQAVSAPKVSKTEQLALCNRTGCGKPGTSRCASCKLVSYCSRECQVQDWKTGGHNKACKSKSQSTATTARKQSPALLKQERLLAQNLGQVDYVIDMPSGSQDCGVKFADAMGGLFFKLMRKKASESHPYAVYRMYEQLSGANPGHAAIIRKQLKREYGVDPLSDEAKNAPADARGEIDPDEIRLMLEAHSL